MSETVRTFIALELPGEVLDQLSGLQEELKGTATGRVSWARPELMHLTIRFLGDIEERQVESITEAIERAVEGLESFELSTTGLGAFPNLHRPKILWIGIADSCQLKAISDRINSELKAIGIKAETKEFRPHLTICRLRERGHIKGLARAAEATATSSKPFEVKEIILFKSEVGGKSPVHTALKRFQLN